MNSQRPRNAVAAFGWLATILVLSLVLNLLPWSAAIAGPSAPGDTCVVLQPGPSAALDSYIKQEKPDELRGTNSELKVKTENGKLMRALLQFDLSSIPSDAVVNSATLSL